MALPKPAIQSFLPGLLTLLGIKNGGQNPNTLGDQLAPVFDMEGYYLRGKQEVQLHNLNPIISGTYNGQMAVAFTVPNGEWWYVSEMSYFYALVAADTLTAAGAGVSYNGITMALHDTEDMIGGAVKYIGRRVVGPFWVPPGGQIIYIGAVATIAGASIATIRAVVTRLTV